MKIFEHFITILQLVVIFHFMVVESTEGTGHNDVQFVDLKYFRVFRD